VKFGILKLVSNLKISKTANTPHLSKEQYMLEKKRDRTR
jgi:hypothetical protein